MYSYRIEKAIRAAAILHQDQVRKGATALPYVTHLFAVAQIVSDYTKKENVIIGALLHDTLEDTTYTSEELEEDFGREVRAIVEAVTEPKTDKSKKLSWKEKKTAYAEKLKTASEESLLIAAADKIHNMRTWVEQYYNDHEQFVKDFGSDLDARVLIYQDISNVLNSRLKNDIIGEFNHVYTEYKNFILNVKQKLSQEK